MNVTTGFRALLADAAREVRALAPAEAIALAKDPDVVFVDLREPEERYRQGYIAGSVHAVRGELEFYVDPDSPLHMPVFAGDRHFVVHCASGGRSALAAQTLGRMGFPRISHIAGGFEAWVAAGGPVTRFNAPAARPQVTGIGGVFLRARNLDTLAAWYERHLGFGGSEAHSFTFRWRQDEDPARPAISVWALFGPDDPYMGPSDRQAMINYRVPDLDALLARLEAAGIKPVRPIDNHEYGRFAWIADCEGNLIELWQPIDGL